MNDESPYLIEQEIISQNSGFAIVEAYKTIRTNLMFSLPHAGCKKVIVTSSMPKEGKSSSIINLALTLALTNARVLLIDCDMRKSAIHKILKMKGMPGLSEYLGGMAQLPEVMQDAGTMSFKVICAGTNPPNPAELLAGEAMEELIASLEEKFDYILMDTPPVNVVADTLALAKVSDGVIMIAREGETNHRDFSKAVSSLKFADAKILGLILNDVQSKTGNSYKKYRYAGDYRRAGNAASGR